MSILIKDIFGKERPMPQEGYIDIRLHFHSGRIERATMQTGTPPFYAMFKVVEIPPHGDLVDRNKLLRIAKRESTYAWKMNLHARTETILNQFIDWLDEAPTVIEGSKE